ncbi:LOW QUALITY PROTEIN: esterase/lipase [Bacillus sp. JCM 19046]|nr:LOW QUALITY PROTEIN: esterase/lipase [Bacillus sp. JCM 19046]
MQTGKKRLVRGSMIVGLVFVVACFIIIGTVQSWRYTEAGRVPPKTAVILHAVDEQLLPQALSTPSFLATPTAPTITRIDTEMATSDGGSIPLRIYKPIAAGPHPVIVYYHGGAFMEGYGNIESHDNVIRSLAGRTQAIVVAPGYRLAPEFEYPTAFNDSYETVKWLNQEADLLDADVSQLAVAGDSAGGNLAAAVSYRAKSEEGPFIKSQVLLYPLTTFLDSEFASRDLYSSGYYFLSRGVMERSRQTYAPIEEDWSSPFTSPLLTEDLSDMPDTLVLTAEFDPLRDEGEAYAKRLFEAGNQVTAVRYDGVMHGFVSFYEVMERGNDGMRQMASYLNQSFSSTGQETYNKEGFELSVLQTQDSWRDELEAYAMGAYLIGRHIERRISDIFLQNEA